MSDFMNFIASVDYSVRGYYEKIFQECERRINLGADDDTIREMMVFHQNVSQLLSDEQFIRVYDMVDMCCQAGLSNSDYWDNRNHKVLLRLMKDYNISSSIILQVWARDQDDFPVDEILDLYKSKIFCTNISELASFANIHYMIAVFTPEVLVKFLERGIIPNITSNMSDVSVYTITFAASFSEALKIYQDRLNNHTIKSAKI